MNSPDQLECAVNENNPRNDQDVDGWLVWLASSNVNLPSYQTALHFTPSLHLKAHSTD